MRDNLIAILRFKNGKEIKRIIPVFRKELSFDVASTLLTPKFTPPVVPVTADNLIAQGGWHGEVVKKKVNFKLLYSMNSTTWVYKEV